MLNFNTHSNFFAVLTQKSIGRFNFFCRADAFLNLLQLENNRSTMQVFHPAAARLQVSLSLLVATFLDIFSPPVALLNSANSLFVAASSKLRRDRRRLVELHGMCLDPFFLDL